MFVRPSEQGPNIGFLDSLAGAHVFLWQCQSRPLIAGRYSPGNAEEGKREQDGDCSILHRSVTHFKGAGVQNYQLVKSLRSFSAPVAETVDLADLTTTENRSILWFQES